MKDDHLYGEFEVKLKFRERVYGGIPKTEKMIENYVSSKFGVENVDLAEELKKEVDLVEETEKVSCGFRRDNGRPFLGDYQLKALLKQSATRLRLTTKKKGSKQDLTDGLFVNRKLFFTKDGEPVMDVDGSEEFCGHVQTRKGKRSILKQSEYIEGGELAFTIRVIKGGLVSAKNIKDLLLLGQEIGLGSNRSFESGKYDLLVCEKAG